MDFVSYKADPATKTFLVRILVDNAKHAIRPGMIARAIFQRRNIPDALVAPLFALMDKGGERILFVEKDGTARARTVSVGIIEGDRVQITSGLEIGRPPDRHGPTGSGRRDEGPGPMILNQAALKRQVTVLTLMGFILIAGIYCYITLPRENFPDITIPYVFVTTTYEGVAPEDMEKLITIPIERKLKGISDVEEIRSTSAEGISTVAVKFLPKVDIDDAVQKVRDKVDQAKKDLPAELHDDPVIQEVNFSDLPVIRVVLSGPFSLKRLQKFAEDMEDRIESIPGVLDARLSGGLEREIHVEFDLDRVGAYNVSLFHRSSMRSPRATSTCPAAAWISVRPSTLCGCRKISRILRKSFPSWPLSGTESRFTCGMWPLFATATKIP